MSDTALTLSPNQTQLLRNALSSNQPRPSESTHQPQPYTPTSGNMSDLTAPGSGHLDFSDDSPYLDFGLDGDIDDSFNYDEEERMIGDLPDDLDASPGTVRSTADLHDKRKSIDGDDNDEGGGKRREGDDKMAKKPGRKPLTSEPTTKRKAQNRAAQRAFRERKEKHLKDLETKVEELEKNSESTNHENGLLRAQVERLQIELREYRKRLSWMTSSVGRPPNNLQQSRNSLSGNDFQFEFPKFGDLPTANYTSGQNAQNKAGPRSSTSQKQSGDLSRTSIPRQSSVGSQGQGSYAGSLGNSPMGNSFVASPISQGQPLKDHANSVDSLSGLFSPSILEAARRNTLGYFPDLPNQASRSGRQSFDNVGSVPGLTSQSSTNTDSPGSSADSQQHISSIGTSPEPLFNSPGTKQDFNLGTINENVQVSNNFGKDDLCKEISQACGTCDDPVPSILSRSNVESLGARDFTAELNTNSFDWLAQQNGGAFDPVLFGDYRETQDNVLSQDFGSFFNDAYPLPDLGSPMHSYGDLPQTVPDAGHKNDLMKQVDAAKDTDEVVPADKGKMLTCNKIWDRLQSMEKFRNGEIDIDNLCSELRAKAKCSEGGAVVDEKHVNKILGM